MKKALSYFHGIVDPMGKAINHVDTLRKLNHNRRGGLRSHKLKGYEIWSDYCDEETRILRTNYKYNGKNYYCILDVVYGHAYEKSPFIHQPKLRNLFLESNGEMINDLITKEHFVLMDDDADEEEEIIEDLAPENMVPCHLHHNKLVICDDMQNTILEEKSLPLVISGVPGSGKSFISILSLAEYVRNASDMEDPWPVLCTTQSPKLLTTLHNDFNTQPGIEKAPKDAVQFKTYQELLVELKPELATHKLVDAKDFETWFKNYLKTHNNVAKIRGEPLINLENYKAAYQEFRIISGYQTKEAYQQAGQKNTLFKESSIQNFLYQAYQSYALYLQKNKYFDPSFTSLPAQAVYKRIYVDEAQDLSLLQLENLYVLSGGQVCYSGDGRQRDDNKDKLSFLTQLFHKNKVTNPTVHLQTSHRCPASVINMANEISRLSSLVTGNGQAEILQAKENSKTGGVLWVEQFAPALLQELNRYTDNGRLVVVAKIEDQSKALALFPKALVLTPEQVKGLQFDHVLLFDVFSSPELEKADGLLAARSDLDSARKNNHNRAKPNQGDEDLGPAFSNPFVACTRPLDSLYIFQPPSRKLKTIHDCLKKVANNCPPPTIGNNEKNQEIWMDYVRMFLANHDIELALTIWTTRLKRPKDEFYAYKESLYPSPRPPVNASLEAKDPKVSLSVSSSSDKKRKTKSTTAQTVLPVIDALFHAPSEESLLKLFTLDTIDEILFKKLVTNTETPGLSLFEQLIDNHTNRNFVFGLINKHINKLPSFNSELLNELFPVVTGITPVPNLFFVLSLYDNGRKLLANLCATRKEFIIMPNTLFSIHLALNANRLQTSAFGALCMHEETQALLESVFVANPKLSLGLGDLIFYIMEGSDEVNINPPSPLFYLAKERTGVRLLRTLVDRMGKVEIPNHVLKRVVKIKTGANAGEFSIPALLQQSEEGKELLALISPSGSTELVEVKKTIAPTMTTAESAEPAEVKKSKAAIYLEKLLANTNGRNLQLLFEAPNLDKLLFHYPVANKSCLFVHLFQDVTKHVFLLNMLYRNASKLRSMETKHLLETFSMMSCSGKIQDSLILLSFSTTCGDVQDFLGYDALRLLLQHNKNLKLSMDLLTLPLLDESIQNYSQDSEMYDNFLDLMMANTTGRNLLKYLVQNDPEFVISDAILHKRPSPLITPTNLKFTNLFYRLCKDDAGQDIIAALLEKNPAMVVSKNDLFKEVDDRNVPSSNTNNYITPLLLLASSDRGLGIIATLCARNPSMLVTAKELCTPAGSNNLGLEHTDNLLKCLCQTDQGISILAQFFKANEELYIPTEEMESSINVYNSVGSVAYTKQVFQYFLNSTAGVEIITTLKDRRAKIMGSRTTSQSSAIGFFDGTRPLDKESSTELSDGLQKTK